ncbi:hypothetical protein NA56DRAFT_703418 [Hyaloscypha hepaticicola]|uniref:2EXR domain-containing protein n=1 Tax=Hyaloscypha hepaticicola TaxID=2082293 RepID=A0A2J6Q663_9HELO|nr:hypothetical protein NA56DRAFT_703418 [Hyaloscypha hepaticicola]
MGSDKSNKERKPRPKRKAGNTINTEAGSEWDFIRLGLINLPSFENSAPSIPSLSPTPIPKSTRRGGKKRRVTFDDDYEPPRRKKRKTENQKSSPKICSESSSSVSSTTPRREALRRSSRLKEKQAISQTSELIAEAGGNAANTKNMQTIQTTVPEIEDKTFNLPALPTEIRAVIWAHLAGYEGPVRTIEVRINQTRFVNPTFTIDSPEGPYQAPDIRTVMACPEGLRQFNARFPNRIRLEGSRDIYFNAARDIIYMDLRSLWALSKLDRPVITLGLFSTHNPRPRPRGFRKIQNLATPFEDNNLQGINDLRERLRGQLKGVVEPIRTLRDVPDAIETLGRLNLHFTTMYLEDRYGQRDSYLACVGEWPSFFGPPT